MSDVCRESGFMSDVCRELGWGIRLMGSGLRSGELSVWLRFDDFETCWARSMPQAFGRGPLLLFIVWLAELGRLRIPPSDFFN